MQVGVRSRQGGAVWGARSSVTAARPDAGSRGMCAVGEEERFGPE